jgi:hypothetical protein
MFSLVKIIELFAVIIERVTGLYEQHQLKQVGKTELRLEMLHKLKRDRRHRQAAKKRSEQATARQLMLEHYSRSKRG